MIKRALYKILIFILIVGTGTSCISSEETNLLQQVPKDYSMPKYQEYRLAVRDVVSCAISTVDEETKKAFRNVVSTNASQGINLTIYEDSTVIIPFFGDVKIAGLTIQEAELKIEKMMRASITDSEVKLFLQSNAFYIHTNEGQGSYAVYKENMTIYQAMGLSQLTSERTDLSRVKVVRKDRNTGLDVIREFDLRSQDVIESEFYYIQPNDVIYFATSKKSFFNVTTVSAFFTTIMTPLSFLFLITKQ